MLFNYFQPWQYALVFLGYAVLLSAVIVYRKANNLTLSLILLVLGAACLQWFAITLDPFVNAWDEQYHALVAKNCMLHPLRPTLYEYPFYPPNIENWTTSNVWIHKQPLFLWQIALSMKIFGINEISLRIPNFIMMTIGTLLVFRIGKIVSGAKTGLYAAIIFTTLHFGVHLTSGFLASEHNDIAFLFYVTASIWAFAEYSYSNNKKWIWIIAVFSAFAVLNKWLTGLLVYGVWGSVLLLYLKKPISIKLFKPIISSFLLSVLIFMPWQIFCSIKYPLESACENALNVKHFFEVVENHGGNQWFYLDWFSHVYNSFSPFLIIPGFVFMVRNSLNKRLVTGLICGVIFIYLFFTFAATKMPAFTFPVAGIICIAFGALFEAIETSLLKISKRMSVVFTILFFLYIYYNFNMQDIEKGHGINKAFPNKSHKIIERSRSAAYYKEISKIIDTNKRPVIFNVPNEDCPMLMFYSGFTCYINIPSIEDVQKLKQENRPIYILVKEKTADYLENDPSVKKLLFPGDLESL